jgi:Protein of unknown function (DUF2723)
MSAGAWLVSRIVIELQDEPWLGTAAAWLFAFGPIVWIRATRPEVHALAAFFAVLTLYAAIRWYRRGEPAWFVIGAAAWGLGIATHPIDAFVLPALVVIVVYKRQHLSRRTFALGIGALILGVAFYAYLPARSAIVTAHHLDPTAALGLPPGQSFWDNDHPSSWGGFREMISGADFSAGGTFPKLFAAQTYADGGLKYALDAWREFTLAGLLLAVVGLVLLVRSDAALGAAVFLALAVPADFSFAYTIEADIERYYLVSFAMIAVLAGYACARLAAGNVLVRAAGMVLLTFVACALLFWNRGTFSQRNDTGAENLIATVTSKTPDNAILISPWLDATPLAYAAYVDHRLGHRLLHSAWYADDAAYIPTWVKTHPVYVVDLVWGTVKGYRLVEIPGSPALYRVVKK